MPKHKPTNKKMYRTPKVLHKGQLKQFAGSPLGRNMDGLSIPGVPKE